MLHLLGSLCISLYLLASIFFITSLKFAHTKKFAWPSLILAFFIHTILGFELLDVNSLFYMKNGASYGFSLSWLLQLIFIVLSRKIKLTRVGFFVTFITAFLLASSSYLFHDAPMLKSNEFNSWIIILHVFPALLAEVSLVFAFLFSLLFLIQEKRIKTKQNVQLIFSTPNIDVLAKLNHYFVFFSFIALSIAFVSILLSSINSNFILDLRVFFAFISWLIFGTLLFFSKKFSLSNNKFAKLTIFNSLLIFFLLAVTFYKTKSFSHNWDLAYKKMEIQD